MPTAYTYTAGQVTLTNNSTAVVGVGTAWKLAGIPGGIVFAEGLSLPLASVTDDIHAVASIKWAGPTGTYDYALVLTVYSQENMQNSTILTRLLAELEAGTIWKFDVAGPMAERATYNERPQGFSYLVIDTAPAQLYIKNSATSGDWEGPFAYATGPEGPPGPAGYVNYRGTYSGATAYAKNDGVLFNNSTYAALQATTGNTPPNYPTTSNAYWQLTALKGTDGTGTGDVTGPGAATDDTPAFYDGTTGKLLKSKTKAQFKTWLAATALDVSFDNSVANLAGNPATVQAAIVALAANTGGGKNDALFALEIADLKGVKMGMVGGVADSFDDETGIQTKTNVTYDAANDWYLPTSTGTLPAYTNTGGTGNRTSIITVTSTVVPASGSSGAVSQLVDGVDANTFFWGAQAVAGLVIQFDFGASAAYIITEARSRTNAGGADGVWQWQGSNNGTSWTNIGATVTLNGSPTKVYTELAGNTTAYRYYRMLGVSGSVAGNNYQYEFEFKIGTALSVTYNNVTLVSVDYAASSVPSTARVALQLADALALTPGTDFTMEVSRDGGTTWTAVTLTLTMPLFGGVKMYEGVVTISGQPSGSTMKWRFKTLTNKNIIASGVVLQQS